MPTPELNQLEALMLDALRGLFVDDELVYAKHPDAFPEDFERAREAIRTVQRAAFPYPSREVTP